MKKSTRTGLHFGLTSGVITTLGLIVGLHAGTHSIPAVVGGVVTIAVADSLSDALGIHLAMEAEPDTSSTDVWRATLVTMLTKMLMAGSFLVPILLLELGTAILAGVAWGLCVLVVLSFRMARAQGGNPWGAVAEHVSITALVIVTTHLLGEWIAATFT